MQIANSELLTNSEAANYIGIKASTLEVWRCTKRHAIPYIKVGRLVRYRKRVLDVWMASRTMNGEVVA